MSGTWDRAGFKHIGASGDGAEGDGAEGGVAVRASGTANSRSCASCASPEMVALQGPSLLCFNDAEFSAGPMLPCESHAMVFRQIHGPELRAPGPSAAEERELQQRVKAANERMANAKLKAAIRSVLQQQLNQVQTLNPKP